MKKFFASALGALLILTASLSVVACGGSGKDTANGVDMLARAGIEVKNIPAVFIDESAQPLTSEDIETDDLVYTYTGDEDVTVALTAGGENASLSDPVTTQPEGAPQAGRTATHTVTAKAAGEYALTFSKDGKEVGSLSLSVRPAYPSDPQFSRLPAASNQFNSSKWGILNAHDPSMIQTGEGYYVFSTGNNGQPGYEIRKSEDLISWEYIGQAISGVDSTLKKVHSLLGAAYEDSKGTEFETKNPDLWAPDVVPAADGGYWLYGSISYVFGDNYSAIFLCHSDKIDGPYKYVETLVMSGGNPGSTNPNAIDPQIFYAADGGMFMTYGSWGGGIRILQLDPATGKRLDGKTAADWPGKTAAAADKTAFYGERITKTENTEGGVVAYRENVGVYDGSALTSYDDSAWTSKDLYYLMGSEGELAKSYIMRQWISESPAAGYGSNGLANGAKVASSFSWRYNAEDERIDYDFYVPGHNDMYTTADGVDLIVYHTRTTFNESYPHYLFLSMYALNARGEIVMSPNRYAGEAARPISAEELCGLSGGMYDYVQLDNGSSCVYAQSGLQFVAGESTDGAARGTLTLAGETVGQWVLFGENYIEFTLNDTTYSGVVLPAWIDAADRAGLTVSALSTGGTPLYMNSAFASEE